MLQAIPHLSRLRDKYIGLASEMNMIVTTAKRAHETATRRPGTSAQPAKRAATANAGAAEAARRFRVLKLWKASKQPPYPGVTFMDIAKDEVLVAVGEEKKGWIEVERTDGSAERGTIPVNLSNGGPRLEEIEGEPEPDAEMAAPIASSEGEDEAGGEEAAARTEDVFAAAQEEADFVSRVQAEEARAEVARVEADAAECGYGGDD